MTLSELVQEYRADHGLSQRQFAALCNLSNGYISMLEKNQNPKTGLPVTPSLPALEKIARGMGMTLTDLFAKVDDMPVDMLVGESENESAPGTEGGLDDLDKELMALLHDLTLEQKQFLLAQLKTLRGQNQ